MSKASEPSIGITVTDKKRKPEPPSVNLDFSEEQKIQPEGFGSLTLDGEVTCTIKGKVTRLATEKQWNDNKAKSIRIEVSSCSFSTDRATPMSMDEAMEEGDKARKRV